MHLKKVIAALGGLTFIIFIHELGHFSFCKLFNIDTPVFSIGFGPTLISKKIGKTNFILAAIPLGGYVSISGMDDYSTISWKNYKDAFFTKPFYQQFLVIIGGILFNLLFSCLVYLVLWATRTNHSENLDEQPHNTPQEKRTALLQSYGRLIGPFGIFSLLGASLELGFRFYLMLLAIISFNLALINLIPLPVLDGGQLVFYGLNALGVSINPVVKGIISLISWIAIIIFFMFVSTVDIRKIFKKS